MAKRVWTKEQLNAIEARRGTILVSAAAGSGKTSVLVQRIIERLIDKESPTDANRLLVVTFTKAAAAEMKERVETALETLIRKNPNDKALKRQKSLMPNMNVSTIDSFCAKLVREFFYLLDVPADFKIIADKQREEFMNDCIEESIEESFEEGNYFIADLFSSDRSDRALKEMVLSLYNFVNSHIFPETWIEKKFNLYDENKEISNTVWGRLILENASNSTDRCINLLKTALKQLEIYGDDKLIDAFHAKLLVEIASLEKIKESVDLMQWDEAFKAVNSYVPLRFTTPRGYADDDLKIRIFNSRDEVKDIMKNLSSQFLKDEKACEEDREKLLKIAKEFNKLLMVFSEKYYQKKLEKKLLDYGDLEHLTVRLLLENGEKEVKPTETAVEIAKRFDEIMVDEYQDTNEVQDSIFYAISRENRFMVGDLKQCIYSFRQAMPEIFLGYKDNFLPYDEMADNYPATVILDRNYRSRNTVIDSTNFVFSQIMTKKSCGLEYTDGESLVAGATYPENADCSAQFDFIEKGELGSEIAESRHIAGLISDMVKNGFKVSAQGGVRNARFEDFAILLRNANTCSHIYAKEMNELGVPTQANLVEDFFTAIEIVGVMAFLQVIDNPNQDIPLLSVLLSPIYGFSADDIAKIRVDNRKISVYLSLINVAKDDERFHKVLEDLKHLRLLSATMPSHEFIEYFYSYTGYLDIALAMKNSDTGLKNLRKLCELAKDYESAGYSFVSDFVRFTDRLRQNGSGLSVTNNSGAARDAVKIMSIHKSKGLEFPVCIVAGCGKKINFDKDDLVLNTSLALGVKLKSGSVGAKSSNFVRDAISLENKRQAIREEMRILYVAMTRAKEKLIMVSSVQNLDKAILSQASTIIPKQPFSTHDIMGISSVSQWLMSCALRHEGGAVLRKRVSIDEDIVLKDLSSTALDVNCITKLEPTKEQEKAERDIKVNEELAGRIREKINFVYPYAFINDIPAKVTATMLSEHEVSAKKSLKRPSFLSEKGMTAAEKGIAMHDFMQFSDFANLSNGIEDEIKRLTKEGFITDMQAKSIDVKKIKAFLNSRLGKRILQSQKIFKEQRFTVNIPANLVRDDLPKQAENENVILQGAIDCSFVGEDNKLHIVDFKTDRIDSVEELLTSHALQLRLYKKALEQISDYEIGECHLYSFFLGDSVELPQA